MYEGDELSKGKPLTLTFFQCGEVLSMIQPEADHGTGLGTILGRSWAPRLAVAHN